jgi:hypothetical protein
MKKRFCFRAGFCLLALLALLGTTAAAQQYQTIAGGLTNPTSILVDGTNVYWTEGLTNQYVKWTNKGTPAPIYSYPVPAPGLHTHSLAQDEAFLYFGLWTPPGAPLNVHPNVGAQIVRLPKFAGPIGPQTLLNFTDPQIFQGPFAFDAGYYGPMDARAGWVYFAVNNFANSQAEEVRRLSNQGATYPSQVGLIGSAAQTVEITGLATDNVNANWAEKYLDNTGAIRSAPLIGGPSTTIAALPGYAPSLVAPTSGAGSGKLFWLESDNGDPWVRLKACQPGGVPQTLASDVFPFMTDVNPALAIDSINLYYFAFSLTNPGQAEVVQRPIAGGTPTTLASGLVLPIGLAGDGAYVYWTDWGIGGAGQGSVNRAAKNVALKADFAASPASGYLPLQVQFTDASTGVINSWLWNFGDGATSTEQSPSHTYTLAKSYKVSLTVTGPSGSSTSTAAIKVSKWPKPKAAFTANPTSGNAPLQVQFTDASTGPITSWVWAFGDGGTSTQQSPSYTYENPGKWKATLTVTGPGGEKSKSATIKVTAAP